MTKTKQSKKKKMKEIEKIEMERTACYGPCPVYKITIFKGGRVEWNGKFFVHEVGKREWNISPENFNMILKSIKDSRFITMKDIYNAENSLPCHPFTYVKVFFMDNTKKCIEHYHGDDSAPKKLIWLENRIDKLVGTKDYIGENGEETY